MVGEGGWEDDQKDAARLWFQGPDQCAPAKLAGRAHSYGSGSSSRTWDGNLSLRYKGFSSLYGLGIAFPFIELGFMKLLFSCSVGGVGRKAMKQKGCQSQVLHLG